MKKYLFLLLSSFSILALSAQSADEELADCLNTNNSFLLDEVYPKLKNDVQTPMLKVLSDALLYASFNQPEKAVEAIETLITDYEEEFGLNNVVNMLSWQNMINFRRGEYQKAIDGVNKLEQMLAPHLDEKSLAGMKHSLRFFRSMQNEPKSELIRPDKDCVIPISIEPVNIENFKKGHMLYVPVTVNGTEEKFIFDTGCPGGAFLSEENARRFGVRTTQDSLRVSGVGAEWGKMGILDSIRIGNMTFKNLVVTIVPPNPAVDTIFNVGAVLASDIMKHAGEVQIFPKEQKIIFPADKTPLPATGRNMLIAQSDHFYIKAFAGDEMLTMHFDTGSSSSDMKYKYYQKHKKEIEQAGTKETSLGGGLGGIVTVEYYRLPKFPLRVGNKIFEIRDMTVNTIPDPILVDQENGALGMSFINLFDKVTISFDNMFVEVE